MPRKRVLLVAVMVVFSSIMILGCTSAQQAASQQATIPPITAIQANGLSGRANPTAVHGLGVRENGNDAPPTPPQSGSSTTLQETLHTLRQVTPVVEHQLPSPVVGVWRIYSSRLFFDIGGAGAVGDSYTTIDIAQDGTWDFGGSTGTWSVEPINEGDWQKWKIHDYGPKTKMVLTGWNNAMADGPIENDSSEPGRIAFFWIIYHVRGPTDKDAGQIQTKFGH